mgnify:CR=1 FL=1
MKQWATCKHWIPNGGILGYGYCRVNKFGYRNPTQTCKTKYVAKDNEDKK